MKDEIKSDNVRPSIDNFICPLCSTGFDDRVHYTIFEDKTQTHQHRVCGRCFMLVSILDELKSIRKDFLKWLTSKT